ncbi:LysR family transcriptional regulator [Streptomyces sp. NPDC020800]|uniref:LysR family transcriptional regulator n=1 Tax=Streptomyces sp. NPDC020800 TaxID=3365092 RepID=UPI0037887547
MLRTFLYVYRCGGVAKAAGLLGLSQPAVSRHLKTLEGNMGRALFDRRGRGVVPTPAGHVLANQVAAHLDALEDAFAAFTPSSTTALLLGAPGDLLSVYVVPALTPLLARGVDVHCRTGKSAELTQALVNDELDLAIVARIEHVLVGQLHLTRLCEEELVLVGQAGEAAYSPHDDTRRFIGYSSAMPMARHYFRACWGIQPPAPALTVADLRTVVTAVVLGAGLSVVPRCLAQRALDTGRLSILHRPDTPVTNSVYLAAHRGRQHLPQIRAARDLLCLTAKNAEQP